ncbi:hypothetical protein [Salinibacter ruber]|uniref:hypothetical protein n=1 Tax=Salinibacter ruber TaxID=146919 RepID=UPI0021677DD8|nr:hypothetical protein [Salinibacter ruber]MCS3610990.1 hypothetical protein [Salinibacter ruber]
MLPDVEVSVEVDGLKDAKRLALAVELLRGYADTHDDRGAAHAAEKAEEALRNLSIDAEQTLE